MDSPCSSNDVLRDTHIEEPVGLVPCTHPLCKAGVRSEVPFYGPVAASVITHRLRKAFSLKEFSIPWPGYVLFEDKVSFLKDVREKELRLTVRELDDEVFIVQGHDFAGAEALMNNDVSDLQALPRLGRG